MNPEEKRLLELVLQSTKDLGEFSTIVGDINSDLKLLRPDVATLKIEIVTLKADISELDDLLHRNGIKALLVSLAARVTAIEESDALTLATKEKRYERIEKIVIAILVGVAIGYILSLISGKS